MMLMKLLLSPISASACDPLVALAGRINDAWIEEIDLDWLFTMFKVRVFVAPGVRSLPLTSRVNGMFAEDRILNPRIRFPVLTVPYASV